MELGQLRCLVAVAEERSFTAAAARERIAQTGVSAHIRNLERELGQPLFDRATRPLTLMAVGNAILPFARTALDSISALRQAADRLPGLLSGSVTIGTSQALMARRINIPRLLATFHRDHEQIKITLTEANTDALVASLLDGTIDLAVITFGGSMPMDITTRVIETVPLAVTVAHDHPFASKRTMSLTDLGDSPLVLLSPGEGARAQLDAAAAQAGVSLCYAFDVTDLRRVIELVTLGAGAALLPRIERFTEDDTIVPIPLTNPSLEVNIALAWHRVRPLSTASQELRTHIEREITL